MGPLGFILGWIGGGFGVVLGFRGHHLGGQRRTWTQVRQKGGRRLSQPPLLARKSGPGSSPGGVQGTRKSAEEGPKKGRKPPPPFLAHLCPSSLPISQLVPPEVRNDPKTSQIQAKMRFKSFRFRLHRCTSLPFFRFAFQQFSPTYQVLDNKH